MDRLRAGAWGQIGDRLGFDGKDGLDLLESKALPDGRFAAKHAWWQAGRHLTSPTDVVDWGRAGPSEVLTLHAASVLRSAGRS